MPRSVAMARHRRSAPVRSDRPGNLQPWPGALDPKSTGELGRPGSTSTTPQTRSDSPRSSPYPSRSRRTTGRMDRTASSCPIAHRTPAGTRQPPLMSSPGSGSIGFDLGDGAGGRRQMPAKRGIELGLELRDQLQANPVAKRAGVGVGWGRPSREVRPGSPLPWFPSG